MVGQVDVIINRKLIKYTWIVLKAKTLLCLCQRHPHTILNICKIADILLSVLSCKKEHANKLINNPNLYGINEVGCKMLSNLRVKGISPSISVLQDIDKISNKR